jgi:hypothetical protein
MGVLMWEACSYGQLPYSSLHNDSDVRQRKLNDERLPQPSQCSHQLWTIMNECWQQESLNRPTFKILKELLLKVGTEPTHRSVSINLYFTDNKMIGILLGDSKDHLHT